MSIFNTTPMLEQSVPASTEFVEPTLEGVQSIIMEAAYETFTLESSFYVSDIIATQRVMEGASMESVLEGFAGSAMAKLKALWTKLWSKIQGWFKAVIKRIQLIFQSGSKFITTFGKELREKSVSGFKYKGYKYNQKDAVSKADGVIAALETTFKDEFKIASDITNGSANSLVSNSYAESSKSEKTSEDIISAAVAKHTEATTISEASEEIMKVFRGGETETQEIENFAATSVENMITIVKEGSNEIARLNRAKATTDERFKKVIKTIDTAATKFVSASSVHGDNDTDEQKTSRNETSSKMTTHFSKVTGILQQVVTGIIAVEGIKVRMQEELVKSYQVVLKQFATFKPKKNSVNESTGNDEDDEDESDLLESAMRFI